jgi:hypothetical protein
VVTASLKEELASAQTKLTLIRATRTPLLASKDDTENNIEDQGRYYRT